MTPSFSRGWRAGASVGITGEVRPDDPHEHPEGERRSDEHGTERGEIQKGDPHVGGVILDHEVQP